MYCFAVATIIGSIGVIFPMYLFPNDIQLVCLGEFDENTGKITPIEPMIVATAKQYIKINKKGEEKKNG